MKEKTGKKKKKLFTILAVVLAVVVGIGACSTIVARKISKQVAELGVTEEQVQKGSIAKTVSGTGSLKAADADRVMVPIGIKIDKVLVKEGDAVEKGTPLAKVNLLSVQELLLSIEESIDTLQTEIDGLSTSEAHYDLKKAVKEGKKAELSAFKAKLEALVKDPTIKANAAGTIEKIGLADETVTTQMMLNNGLENQTTQTPDPATLLQQSGITGRAAEQKDGTGQAERTANEAAAVRVSAPPEGAALTEIKGRIDLTLAQPVTGAVPETVLNTNEPETHYSGTAEWTPAAEKFAPDTAYTATVYLQASDGYCFTTDEQQLDVNVNSYSGVAYQLKDMDGDGYAEIMKLVLNYPKTAAEEPEAPQGLTPEQIEQLKQAAQEAMAQGTGGLEGLDPSALGGAGFGSFGGTDLSGLAGAGLSGAGLSGAAGAAGSGSVYEAAGITIVPADTMKLTISVDELDIQSLQNGMSASVTLDAVEGTTFAATVKSIAASASSAGVNGAAKYSVELELPADKQMKYGMSATAVIGIESHSDVLLISMSALQEEDGKTFVYTKKEDGGVLSGRKEVTTGLSDNQMVEILSGLKEGETIYYQADMSYDMVNEMYSEHQGTADGESGTSTDGGTADGSTEGGTAGGTE